MTPHATHFRHQYVAVHILRKANLLQMSDRREARLMNVIIKMVIQLPRYCKYHTIHRKSRLFIEAVANNR